MSEVAYLPPLSPNKACRTHLRVVVRETCPTQAILRSSIRPQQGCGDEEEEIAFKKRSPSIKSTKLPFQIALLRATELAQILLVGQHESITEPAGSTRQEPPRPLRFILLPGQSRGPDGDGE